MAWQSLHFSKVWASRTFTHLEPSWKLRCSESLIQSINAETVIDILLGCEKFRSHSKTITQLVKKVTEKCLEFLASSYSDFIIKSFYSCGADSDSKLSVMEDHLPSIIHNLSAEETIRTFLALKQLLGNFEWQKLTCTGDAVSQKAYNPVSLEILRN